MGISFNPNNPIETNELAVDLDDIRDQLNFMQAVAASGSLVLPGWSTHASSSADPPDLREPTTVELRRGRQKIFIHYTWTDGNVSAIQFCYDDGVSAGQPVCFDPTPLFFDEDGNLVGTFESAFEDAIGALGPVANYRFRDADFASQILDSSGNDYHLTKQIATASRGAKLRTTHPGGLVIPAISNWPVDGIHYLNASGGLDTVIGGATSVSIVIGLQITAMPTTNNFFLFSTGIEGAGDSGNNHLLSMLANNALGALWFKERHSTGIGTTSDNSPLTGEPVIYTNRFHYSVAPEKHLDRGAAGSDSELETGALSGGSIEDQDRASFIGGRTGAGTSGFGEYIIDHLSIFVPSLTVADLDALRAAYVAELV